MDRLAEMVLLGEFYGGLLTGRQQECFRLYYEQDLSLGEIAEYQGISRQAVHDRLQRAERALRHYEARLGLVADYIRRRRLLETALRLVRSSQAFRRGDRELDLAARMLEKVLRE